MFKNLPVFVAVLAALLTGCSTVDLKKSATTAAGDKQEEALKCEGWGCSNRDRPIILVPRSRYESAYGYGGYGYERNYLDGSRRGACYGVVQGPGPNDRKVRYEPTLERDQFGRPTVWTCAPGRRNSPPDPDGCCSD